MNIREEIMAGLIRCRLCEDQRVAGQTIDVVVCDGDVFLAGCVDSPEQRETAEMLVKGLMGVRRVVDNIQVRGQLIHQS